MMVPRALEKRRNPVQIGEYWNSCHFYSKPQLKGLIKREKNTRFPTALPLDAVPHKSIGPGDLAGVVDRRLRNAVKQGRVLHS